MKGIIVAHEATHSTRKLRAPCMIVELDILKVYDLVDGQFLPKVLSKFGFEDRWVE